MNVTSEVIKGDIGKTKRNKRITSSRISPLEATLNVCSLTNLLGKGQSFWQRNSWVWKAHDIMDELRERVNIRSCNCSIISLWTKVFKVKFWLLTRTKWLNNDVLSPNVCNFQYYGGSYHLHSINAGFWLEKCQPRSTICILELSSESVPPFVNHQESF